MSEIRYDEWVAAITALEAKRSDPGQTFRELQAGLKCTRLQCYEIIRKLKEDGRLIAGRRVITTIADNHQSVPVYLLREPHVTENPK